MNNVQNIVAQNVSFDVLFYGALILLLFLGGVFCLFGQRVLKIFMGIIGCLLGGLSGFDLGQVLGHHNLLYSVLGAVLGCSIGAVIGVFFYWINIFLVGYAVGFTAVGYLWMYVVILSGAPFNPFSAGISMWVTTTAAGVAVGLLALKAQKHVVILFTSLNGAELMVISVFAYCHRELMIPLLQKAPTGKVPFLEKDIYNILFAVLAITALGVLAQLTDKSAQKKPPEAKPQKA